MSIVSLWVVLAGCSASVEIDEADLALGGPMDSAEVYDAVRDSIVFLATPDNSASGSGIVVEDRWILTNAHVVELFDEMRVGRSDGTDVGMLPVHAVDRVLDLALIGPVDDAALASMPRGVSADLTLGDKVLLVGFPDESDVNPTPTLTEGIVSRRRSIAVGDIAFLQVDATIAPGQSGGALVNSRGEMVGVSGLQFGQGGFGLVLESDAIWARVEEMIASPVRLVGIDAASEKALVGEVGPLTNYGFIAEVNDSGALEITVQSSDDVFINVQTLGGVTVDGFVESEDVFRTPSSSNELYLDGELAGGESLAETVEPGRYQVIVGSFGETVSTIEVTSPNRLFAFSDAEERAELAVGGIVEGQIDWGRDSDKWQLELEAGQTVRLRADGITDTVVVVRLDDVLIAASDDEGIGLFGTGSELEFTAEDAGTYTVEVGTFDLIPGGYLLQVTVS